MRKLRRRRDEGGAAAVEFAFVLIPLFAMIAGLIQYGWFFYVASNTSGAASNVARKLEVGDCWASGAAKTYASKQSPQVTGLVISPAATAPPADGTSFTVTVTANGRIFGFLPMPNGGTVTRTVSSQVDDNTPSSC